MNIAGTEPITLDDIVVLASRLSTLDKVRLVERLMAGLEQDLQTASPPSSSAFGILADLGPAPSEKDIDEVRREMWEHVGEGDDY